MKQVYAIQNDKGEVAYVRADSSAHIRQIYTGMGFVKNPHRIIAIYKITAHVDVIDLPKGRKVDTPLVFNSYENELNSNYYHDGYDSVKP